MFLPGDDDSKDRVRKKKKVPRETEESSVTNGKKTKTKKHVETKTELIVPSDSNSQLIEEMSVNDEHISKQLSREKKSKGVSALKAKKSGVVAIKRVKRKGKHNFGASDVIADISGHLDVGTGIGSSW